MTTLKTKWNKLKPESKKKFIILAISIVIVFIGYLPFIEGSFYECAPILDFGFAVPHVDHCNTILFSLILIPGFFLAMLFGDYWSILVLTPIFNVVIYYFIGALIGLIIRKMRGKVKKIIKK